MTVPFGSMVLKHLYVDLIERKGGLIGVIVVRTFFFRMKLETAQPGVSLRPYPACKNGEQAWK